MAHAMLMLAYQLEMCPVACTLMPFITGGICCHARTVWGRARLRELVTVLAQAIVHFAAAALDARAELVDIVAARFRQNDVVSKVIYLHVPTCAYMSHLRRSAPLTEPTRMSRYGLAKQERGTH